MRTTENKEERKAEMLTLWEAGLSLREIGDTFGLTRERVRQIIGNHRHSFRQTWMKDHRAEVETLRKQGMYADEIAAQLKGKKEWVNSLRIPRASKMKHGTASMYQNGPCRCDLCRKALADRMRKRNAERRAKGLCIRCTAKAPNHWHCERCRKEISIYMRDNHYFRG